MQSELSSALITFNHLIKLLDLPAKTSDNLCSVLQSTIIDYPQQVNLLPIQSCLKDDFI